MDLIKVATPNNNEVMTFDFEANKVCGDKISKEDTRLAVIEHRLGTITWLIMAVCGGVITTLVKLFLGG